MSMSGTVSSTTKVISPRRVRILKAETRRLRTFDGVNFTKAGAEKLAHYVEHELRRVMTNPVVPVALPGPEEQPKGNVRPEIGPVVPLTATGGGEGGDLLGAGNHPAQHEPDPVATRVLTNGEALAAPSGRADDFSWPRTDVNASAPDVTPSPPPEISRQPAAKPAAKSDGGKNETNKTEPNKNDARKPGAARTEVSSLQAPRRHPRVLDSRTPRSMRSPRPPHAARTESRLVLLEVPD